MSDYNIDDSDVDFAILVSQPSGCLGLLVMLAVVGVLAYYAYENKADCAQRACPEGQTSKLVDHDCLCVVKAKASVTGATP